MLSEVEINPDDILEPQTQAGAKPAAAKPSTDEVEIDPSTIETPKDKVRRLAPEYGVDPDIAERLAHQESGFNQRAISPKGAIGVMQLMPLTAKGLNRNPHDLEDNIRGGLEYFKQHLDEFKDTRLALAAYNAGPQAVRDHKGIPPYKETQDYVNAIAGRQPSEGEVEINPDDIVREIPLDQVKTYPKLSQEVISKGMARAQGGIKDNSIGRQLQVLSLNADLLNLARQHGPRLAELEAKQNAASKINADVRFGGEPLPRLTDAEQRELDSLHQMQANIKSEMDKQRPQEIEGITKLSGDSRVTALGAFIQNHGALTDPEREKLGLPTDYLTKLSTEFGSGVGTKTADFTSGVLRIADYAVKNTAGSTPDEFLQRAADYVQSLKPTIQQLQMAGGAQNETGLKYAGGVAARTGGELFPTLVGATVASPATLLGEGIYWGGTSAIEGIGRKESAGQIAKGVVQNLIPIAGAKFFGRLATGSAFEQFGQRVLGNSALNATISAAQGGDLHANLTAAIMGGFMGIGGHENIPDDVVRRVIVDPEIQADVADVIAKPKLSQRDYSKLEAKLQEAGLTPEQSQQLITNLKESVSPTTEPSKSIGETTQEVTTPTSSTAATTTTEPPPIERDAEGRVVRKFNVGKENQNATQTGPVEQSREQQYQGTPQGTPSPENGSQVRPQEGEQDRRSDSAGRETQGEGQQVGQPSTPSSTDNLVGIKNEFLESQAAGRQEPLPSTEPQQRDFQTVIQEGKNQVDSGRINPSQLAADIANKPRSLTPEESAAMLYHHTQLLNEEGVHLKAIQDARAANDPIAEANARIRLNQTTDELNKIRGANKLSNYEKGLSLAINKAMMNEDYSLARMEARAVEAKRGKPLSPREKGEIEDVRNQMLKDQASQEAFDEKKSKGEASKTIEQLRKETMADRKAGRSKKKSDLDTEFAEHKATLAKLFSKEPPAPGQPKGLGGPEAGAISGEALRFPLEVVKVIRAMAKNRIAAGVNSLDGVVDSVHEAMSEFGDFTKRQVRDAFSGYGRLAKLSKDPLDVQMRELGRIGRLISAIEDAEKGEPPARSGLQRDQPSQRVRDLRKQLDKAMKDNGLEIEKQPRSPEDQMKSSLDAAKTHFRNMIDDLDRQLAGESLPDKSHLKIQYDDEAIALMSERNILKRQLEDPAAKNKAEVQARLDEVNRKLNENDLSRQEAQYPATIYDDAKTTQMRADLKELNRQLNERRALPDKIKDLEDKIVEAKSKLASGDLSQPTAEEKATRPTPQIIRDLKSELKDLNKQLSEARQDAKEVEKLESRKADLQRRIREKDFSQPEKGQPREVSDKVKALRIERDELLKTYNGLRPASKLTDAQKLDIATKAAQRSLDEYNRKIDAKEFLPTEKEPGVTSPTLEALKAKRDQAKQVYEDLQDNDPQVRAQKNAQQLANYKKKLVERQAELDKMAETEKFYTNDKGQLSTSKPKNKIPLDAEAEQLKANTARSKAKAEAIIRRIQEENRTPLEKAIGIAPKFFEWVKLSSSLVVGKLAGFGAARVMLLDPMEGLIGATDRFNPATKAIREATYEKGGRGQSTVGDYVAAVGDLWKNYLNVFKHWDIIRGRHTDLDLKYGKPNELPIEMLGLFRRVHKALKNPVVDAEFNRYNKGYLRQAQVEGLDVTHPQVILEAGMKSYAEAYRDILLGKNRLSDTFSQKVGELGRGSVSDQIIAAGFRSALPIVKVPINYAIEESSYGLGAAKGQALLFNKGFQEGKATNTPVRNAVKAMFGQGLQSLTPDEAQQVLRAYHKQGIGMALMALGYFGYKSIGGYFISVDDQEKRKSGKSSRGAGVGQTKMFGVTIPSPLVHNPAFEAMQGMATFHHAMDYYKGKAKSDSLLDPALASIRGSLEHIPFYEEPARAFRGLESGQKLTDFMGNEVRGAIIPPDVQRLARIQDQREPQNAQREPQVVSTGTKVQQMLGVGSPNTKKRKAKGSALRRIWQQVEQGIPKVPLIPISRQNVPLKPSK